MSEPPPIDPTLRPLTAPGADPRVEIQERLRQATVGEYAVLGRLGFGRMASVSLARDLPSTGAWPSR
ncbi:MAG: hypothetical protein KJZ47_03300 [Gemmatimonadales bacterium]|nr:hypothetical protein [Gemmatimonadales bacterium]